MSPMRCRGVRRAAALLAMVAVLFASGSHWALLQSVAWAVMVVRFAQEGSLGDAIEKTFDGEHPCALCLKVQEGRRHKPWPSNPSLPASRLDLMRPEAPVLLPARSSDFGLRAGWSFLRLVSFQAPPPKPPPRDLAR